MDGAKVTQTSVDDCEDMMQEMLTKLPAKALTRFKQVSKRWFERITSLDFAKMHYSIAKKQQHSSPVFLLRSIYGNQCTRFITSISIAQHQENNYTSPIQYENLHLPYLKRLDYRTPPPLFSVGLGLYCMFKFRSLDIALWNPTTREIKMLPSSPFPVPSGRRQVSGFGHAEIKDGKLSYKVGMLCLQQNSVMLDLYSSVSESWKSLASDIRYIMSSDGVGVNLKGILHLLSSSITTDPYIFTFDYASEAFGTMEMPDLSYDDDLYLYTYSDRSLLTLHDDTLCLFRYQPKMCEARKQTFFEVWVMSEYGVKESWCKKCTVGPFNKSINILGYWKSLGGILLLEYDGQRTRLFLYKCASSELMDLNVGSGYLEDMKAYECVESLVSIKGTPDQCKSFHQDMPLARV